MFYDEKECEDWKRAFVPCRIVSAWVGRDRKVMLRDQMGRKPPCSSFARATGDACGARIYLDPDNDREASSYWSALKKAMIESVAQDMGIVNEKISKLTRELEELKDERVKLKTALADVRKLKIE